MKTHTAFMALTVIVVSTRLTIATSDLHKSFLDAASILNGWESSYGSIRTMKVAYKSILEDYQPPADNPDVLSLVKYFYVERIESGKRHHTRLSITEDGFERPESLMEYAFNGEVTQEYLGSTKHGSIVSGLLGKSVETDNYLKQYMLLDTSPAPEDMKDEYPNGVPEMVRTIKLGIAKGKVTVRPRLESVAGQLCHVIDFIRRGESDGVDVQIKSTFWLAHDKGMCLMKYQYYCGDDFGEEIEVKQISETNMNGNGVWYPVVAYLTMYNKEFGTTKRKLTVMEFLPNIEVNEDTFRFDFPAGTEVFDRVSGLSYVIGGAGPGCIVRPS